MADYEVKYMSDEVKSLVSYNERFDHEPSEVKFIRNQYAVVIDRLIEKRDSLER